MSKVTFNAATIRQAIYVIQQYLEKTFPLIRLSLTEKRRKVVLELTSRLEDNRIARHMLDGAFCLIFNGLQTLTGKTVCPELRLPYDNPEEYRKILGAGVEKGEGYKFIFDKQSIDREINRKRIREIEILLPQFLVILNSHIDEYGAFSLQVRNRILNLCAPDLPALSQVAASFCLGERTFQRKLADEDQSFRQICADIKQELASYLVSGRMKTREIACLLGYSDASAYLHAAKSWKLRKGNVK